MSLKPIIAGQFYNQPPSSSPGGSNGQAQYNNAGAFGGFSGLTIVAGALTQITLSGDATITRVAAGVVGFPQGVVEIGNTLASGRGVQLDQVTNAGRLNFTNGNSGTILAFLTSGQTFNAGNFTTPKWDVTDDGPNSVLNGTGAVVKLQKSATSVITLNGTGATGLQFNGYGAGAITSDASGNLTAVSDERLKTNIKPFTRGLKDIVSLANNRGAILYRWSEESGMETEHEYGGFSAQRVQSAIPEAVSQNSDGYFSLNDRAILAALVNAVSELALKL